MKRHLYHYLFLGVLIFGLFAANAQSQSQTSTGAQAAGSVEVWGQESNGLKPSILARKLGPEWIFDLEFMARSNFAKFAWMRTTNRSGSTLHLALTNGTEVPATNADVLAAELLPAQTSVSSIFLGVPWRARGNQWMHTRLNGSRVGDYGPGGHFDLISAFGVPATNEFVLTVGPLLYRVGTNRANADLIKFAPVRLKLMTNGNVEVLGQRTDPGSRQEVAPSTRGK